MYQVRTLEVCENSFDEIKNFEYSCLGEVRMLSALRHSCIVEMYGHKISSKWVSSEDGKSKRRILQYAIFMEYIKGGSLKVKYLCIFQYALNVLLLYSFLSQIYLIS